MNVDALDGSYFIDTNVLIHTFDSTAPDKQRLAQDIVTHALRTQRGAISSQVVQEFLNAALKKFTVPMSVSDARAYTQAVLLPLCQHFPSQQSYDHALLLKEETGFAFYDALIVAAAADIGCATLLSEDLQHGRKIRGLTIFNPFRA